MQMSGLIRPEAIILGLAAPSKPLLFQALAKRAAALLGLPETAILHALTRREALGSTGIGQGIALPHASIEGLAEPFGLLAQLKRPLAYEAIDDQSVDIVCLILNPVNGGKGPIDALACVAKCLRSHTMQACIRNAKGPDAIRIELTKE